MTVHITNETEAVEEAAILNGLDHGIRQVVAWLRSKGYETTDSGDGVTKLKDGWDRDCVLEYAHVIIWADPLEMVSEAHRLLKDLREAGIKVITVGEMDQDGKSLEGCWIQLTYDPVTEGGIIELSMLNDEMFLKQVEKGKPLP